MTLITRSKNTCPIYGHIYPPPPPKKDLTSTPWPGQLFYNLTSGHYENNNRLSVFSMTDCTEKISKIIFFYYVFILALTLEPTSLIQGL